MRNEAFNGKKCDPVTMDRANRNTIRRIELAHQILHLARERAWQSGHHLTEEALADTLGVSRSPIRAALRLLQERGVVTGRRNQGFSLNVNPSDLMNINIEAPPAAEDDLYLAIIDARLKGALEDSFTQMDLMRRFDVPRSLFERAVGRLMDEGIVARRKGRGWTFLPTYDTDRSLRHSYQLRMVLEPAGILLPQFTINHEALTRSRLAHHDLLTNAEQTIRRRWIFSIDSEFHEMIAGFTGNPLFLQVIQHQNRLRRLLEIRGYSNRRRIVDWCEEHLAVIDALERGNLPNAANLLRVHLSRANEAAATERE